MDVMTTKSPDRVWLPTFIALRALLTGAEELVSEFVDCRGRWDGDETSWMPRLHPSREPFFLMVEMHGGLPNAVTQERLNSRFTQRQI